MHEKEAKMNPTQLAGIIKRVYPNFDMNLFEDRLKLQKLIYLMKVSGLDLGYNFRLYLKGPYATLLARDGFDMPPIRECQPLKFEEANSEKLFLELLDFIKDKKDDAKKMEIIASLYKFHELFPDKKEEEIVKLVKDKSITFSKKEKEIEQNLIELKKSGIIKW